MSSLFQFALFTTLWQSFKIMAKYRHIQRQGSYYCHSDSSSSNSRLFKVPRVCWETAEGRRPDTSSSFSSHTLTKSLLTKNKKSQWAEILTTAFWLPVFLTEMPPHKALPCDDHHSLRLRLGVFFGESEHQSFLSSGSVKGIASF